MIWNFAAALKARAVVTTQTARRNARVIHARARKRSGAEVTRFAGLSGLKMLSNFALGLNPIVTTGAVPANANVRETRRFPS